MEATPKSPTREPSGRTADALRAHGYRATAQRLVIQRVLEESGRHLSAEDLRRLAGERLPALSLPTVYAALEALEDAGLVRRISAGRDRALFDARPTDHHHLACRRCGAVEDVG